LLGTIPPALILYPWAGVTEANFARVRVGMTEREVEALLGGAGICAPSDPQEYPTTKCWRDDQADYHVYINFDRAGLVEAKDAGRLWPAEPLFYRLRHRLFGR
jgi:SmpA / OmlA family